MCNCTYLTCRGFDLSHIDVEISVENHIGKRVFTPRITFLPDCKERTKFSFKHTQFPSRLSITMTINKFQRQTLDFFGIYLLEFYDFLWAIICSIIKSHNYFLNRNLEKISVKQYMMKTLQQTLCIEAC